MSRILILDDRAINRLFLTTLLSYKGFETREANDGVEGLEIVRVWRPDLAIVDIEMPRMNGVDFVRHLRDEADLASIAIIFYTASYEVTDANRLAESCGVSEMLMKPSEPEVILETIQRALGNPSHRPRSHVAEEAASEFVRVHEQALRASALVEFQMEVSAQRRPDAILANLARAARNIVRAEHSIVTIVDAERTFSVSSSKQELLATDEVTWAPHCPEHLSTLVTEAKSVLNTPFSDCANCFVAHANVINYIGIPIGTATRQYGWLCLLNRDGAEFSLEDERILQTIAAPTAMAYENVRLYEELRGDAELLRATIEASGDGILVIDCDEQYVTYNQRFVDIWHIASDVLHAANFPRTVQDLLDQVTDRDAFSRMIERAEADREAEFTGAFELSDRRSIECHVAPRLYDGKVIGQVWTFRDVSQRNRMEAALLRFARDRELLLESTGDGIFAIDSNGHCTMANRVAATLLGRPLKELIGSRIHDLIHSGRRSASGSLKDACAVDCALKAIRPQRSIDEMFWRSDGTAFPVEYVSSFIIDEGRVRGMVVSFSDVTERRRLERRLDQVSRINSLGRMAATIAHEFNNVLMGIQPFAEVIRIRASGDEKIQKAATQILNSVTRGKSVTQDIMRMTASPEPSLHSTDIAEWIEQIASEIRALVGGRIVVEVEAPPIGTLFARCDPSQMQQVVTNLALNARDAMPRGGRLTFSAAQYDDSVRLVVADSGSGIPPETLPFIFEPLFTTKKTGTGLGLAVAQQLVAGNGGTMSVESTVGEGTRFQIDLPVSAPHASPAGEEERRTPQQSGVNRVLIVEDDPAVGPGIAAVLESEGVEVCVVTRGGDALAAVETFAPDVVMIDVTLPDISGTAVYEQIVARWPSMRVIFSTGHADESRLPQHASKHVGFLRKPYSTATLLTKLREVV
jgi:PAS domain S-box-containing protein